MPRVAQGDDVTTIKTGADLAQAPRDSQRWIEGFEAMNERMATGPLGARLTEIDDERAVIEMVITDAARQPYGLLHGGVSMVLAESATSMHSAWLADLSREAPVGLEINGTHLSSASQGTVRATARLIRRARQFVFHEVDIEHVETGRLLCKARVTNYLKPLGG